MGNRLVTPEVREGTVDTLPEFASASMREFLATLRRVALTELPVVIAGEQGSGKEWASRLLHRLSPRAAGPFLSVDCGAGDPEEVERRLYGFETISWAGVQVRPGAFEEAGGGTLHLDEAGRLPADVLARVARVAEYRRVRRMGGDADLDMNARLVATLTTSSDEVAALLREEPWPRMSPIALTVPPLRNRPEDLPLYVERFIEELRTRHALPVRTVSDEAMAILAECRWPGNVRALKNALEYAAVFGSGETIRTEHLPTSIIDQHHR
jgi:DNA-binding NtrC family response regulator